MVITVTHIQNFQEVLPLSVLQRVPVVLADAGVENVNAQVDELIDKGGSRHLLAFTELKLSNSIVKAW